MGAREKTPCTFITTTTEKTYCVVQKKIYLVINLHPDNYLDKPTMAMVDAYAKHKLEM